MLFEFFRVEEDGKKITTRGVCANDASVLCEIRRDLSTEHIIFKVGVETAESKPSEVYRKLEVHKEISGIIR